MSKLEFEQLYKKYENELYSFIYSISRRDSYAAEDILQNTMINVYKYLHTLRDKSKLKSWIFAIAKQEANRYYSKKEFIAEVKTPNIEDIADLNEDEILEPDFSFDVISTEQFIETVSQLDEDEQTIIYLRYKFGLKLNEISKIWHINRNTVKSLHFRAIKKLRHSIEKKGYDFD